MTAWRAAFIACALTAVVMFTMTPRTRSGRLARLAFWRVAKAALSMQDEQPSEDQYQIRYRDGDVQHWRSL